VKASLQTPKCTLSLWTFYPTTVPHGAADQAPAAMAQLGTTVARFVQGN
jgi:hypothetical protein